MKNVQTLAALLAIVALCSVPVCGETLEPLTISPGAVDRFTGVEVRCPTFSWQAVPGVVGYEVVAYELPPQTDLAAWSLDEAVEVLFVELPAGVTGWTPSLERGLARGADYVWFVRGVLSGAGLDDVVATERSVARFFRLSGGVVDSETEVRSRGGSVTSGTGTGTGAGRTRVAADRNVMAKRVGEKNTKDVGTAMAAIRGEMSDVTGETYGVVGISNSLDGGGLAGVNTTEGPDLVLDGQANGRTDSHLFDWGLDRSSPAVEVFGFTNEVGGTIDVWVGGDMHARALFGDGTDVTDVDAASLDGRDGSFYLGWGNLTGVPGDIADGDNDTLGEMSCSPGEIAKWSGSAWVCMSEAGVTYSRTFIVGPVGTPTENGAALVAAMDAIPTPTGGFEGKAMLRIEPGTYDLDGEALVMKQYVDVEGAGREYQTVIKSERCGASGNDLEPAAVVVSGLNTELRDLMVMNTCDTDNVDFAVGIFNDDTATVISRVYVYLFSIPQPYGVYGIYTSGFGLEVTDVEVLVTGHTNAYGIYSTVSGLNLTRVSATSQTTGGLESVAVHSDGDNLKLRNVVATGVAGIYALGIRGNGRYGILENVTARGTNASVKNTGVHLDEPYDLGLDGVIADGDEVGVNLVVPTGSSALTYTVKIRDLDTTGVDAGLRLEASVGSIDATVHRSTINGDTNSVWIYGSTLAIGGSQLSGGAVYGVPTCAGVYDENFVFYPDTCP